MRPSTGSGHISDRLRAHFGQAQGAAHTMCAELVEAREQQAQETLPISATSSSLAMRLAISSEAVAAGDGALSTWTWRAFRS